MKVSELAHRAGIAASAVRFYEAEGILPGARRSGNGYRDYGEADLCRLRMVVSLRKLGVDLQECGRLSSRCCGDGCDEIAAELADVVARRRKEVAVARDEIDHLDRELANLQQALASGRSAGSLCREERSNVDGP